MDVVYLRGREEGGRRELRGRWRELFILRRFVSGFSPFCRRVNEPTYLTGYYYIYTNIRTYLDDTA